MATVQRTTKPARLAARLTPQQKELVEQAASLQGLTLTEFVVQSVQAAAEAVVRNHRIIELSARDSLALAEALLNPRPLTPELREALRDHAARAEQRP
ncbi:MAG: DUF1778 domain-containing protein [Thermomicrobiales bacterium]